MAKASTDDRAVDELTPDDAADIKYLLVRGHHQKRIAALFDVNQGRISEIKTGRRFANVRGDQAQFVPRVIALEDAIEAAILRLETSGLAANTLVAHIVRHLKEVLRG